MRREQSFFDDVRVVEVQASRRRIESIGLDRSAFLLAAIIFLEPQKASCSIFY